MPPDLHSLTREPKQEAPSGLLVLLHGLGSNEEDLMALSELVDTNLVIVSLRAPEEYGPGYKWFSFDISGGSISYNAVAARESVDKVSRHVEAVQTARSIGPDRTVIAGFSQGAMIALGTVLLYPRLARGAWIMSGAIIPELFSEFGSASSQDLRILIQHGSYDDVLPVALGRLVKARLEPLFGSGVTYSEYRMGHTISSESVRDAAEWMAPFLAPQTSK